MANKVGLLVPFYNQEHFAGDALVSYLKQDYENIKVYALDDHSTDKTDELVVGQYLRLRKYGDFMYINNSINIGCFRSYNMLAYFAIKDGCDFVMPCGGDDIMERNCISTAMKYFEKQPELQALDLPVVTFGIEDGIVMRPQSGATYESAWNQNPWTSFMIYRSELWNKYNGYDTSLTPAHIQTGIEDCEFHLRLLRDKVKVGFMQEIKYKYRIHENNSHRHASPHYEELYKIIREKHGFTV